ncbi:MAG: metallophosphatase family protein [Chloroflexi bacterium]|nr:metallophosphatase family protein [Chloroflexota bacterium]MCL5075894.1 metallophosphatase family protein [Chloroflexota bacterium]
MRIAAISDIHANLKALEAVLDDIYAQQVDQVVVAGDLAFGGPEPSAVLERLLDLPCPIVQGNTDAVVSSPDLEQRAAGHKGLVVLQCLWAQQQLEPKQRRFLAELPLQCTIAGPEGTSLLVVHATPRDQSENIFPDTPEEVVREALAGADSPLIVCGHVHLPFVRPINGRLWVNVGSVGRPFDGDLRAGYGLLTYENHSWKVEHRRVAYDVEATVEAILRRDMPGKEIIVESIRKGLPPHSWMINQP